jgi:hypothetical protein
MTVLVFVGVPSRFTLIIAIILGGPCILFPEQINQQLEHLKQYPPEYVLFGIVFIILIAFLLYRQWEERQLNRLGEILEKERILRRERR